MNYFSQIKNPFFLLISLLIFEGFFRKISPSFVSTAIFFLKDIFLIYFVIDSKILIKTDSKITLLKNWKVLFILFWPVFINTMFYDVNLVLFGGKQYLLYYFCIFLCIKNIKNINDIEVFYDFITYSIILTSIVAIIQIQLPTNHWLNSGTSGEDLSNFARGGISRVSSTFSFTAQFSFYLNFVTSIFVGYLLLNFRRNTLLNFLASIGLIISLYTTGGRTAILGGVAIFLIGFILLNIKPVVKSNLTLIVFGGVLFISINAIQNFKPELFEVYEIRSASSKRMSNNEEIFNRVAESFMMPLNKLDESNFREFILGKGLGVMSNGSEKISEYAKKNRENGFWTETDFPTTLWEGGVYLVIIWYFFRLSMIIFCFKLFIKNKNQSCHILNSFILAFIIIQGLIGTLGIQSPLSIWWFSAIGIFIANYKVFNFQQKIVNEAISI